ncbi:MAG: DNA-binding protein [Mogibacterium sp.]|nr:DNA-binding protein [Mogibacterium sp.]
MSEVFLGIDTSNYKTSVAAVDGSQTILRSLSEFLPVRQGERGLRQETAFFLHAERLPDMIREVYETVSPRDIHAVAVSYAPRRAEGSYMPVFQAGVHAGRVIADTLGVPYYEFSHQEGHIESVMHAFDVRDGVPFLFSHLSGGTTEFLRCVRTADGYETEIVGGTLDISIGQLIDRAGVKLGHAFPAGKYLDEIAATQPVTALPSRVKIRDGYFNLSGTETQVLQSIEAQGDAVVPGLFRRIAELIATEADQLATKCGICNIYIAGGVAASRTIRGIIAEYSNGSAAVHFGDAVLSGDNAVGTAWLGERKHHGA